MTRRRTRLLGPLLAPLTTLALACGSSGGSLYTLDVGTSDAGPSTAFGSGDASGSGALDAHVEQNHVTVTFVTLSCTGPCADVVAVATGGRAPYSFRWDDGSTRAARHVCPTSSTSYLVKVTDTGASGELALPPQTVQVPLTANVIACRDGGSADAGPGNAEASCFLKNPSFEGTPTVGAGDLGPALPDWSVCTNTPDVNPLFATLPASDRSTYLGVVAGTSPLLVESAGAAFCSPLEAMQPVSFAVDVAVSSYIGGAGSLELWGGATPCSRDVLLWSSPTLTQVDQWKTFCGTFMPSKVLPYLVVWPVSQAAGGAYVLVDNFRPRPICP